MEQIERLQVRRWLSVYPNPAQAPITEHCTGQLMGEGEVHAHVFMPGDVMPVSLWAKKG
ncbi:MAG: hypothetical protein R2709_06275 [Marmoricola sp.]